MNVEDKIKQLLEIKEMILSGRGEENDVMDESSSLTTHPDPLSVLLNFDDFYLEEFKYLMFNYEPIVLPYSTK